MHPKGSGVQQPASEEHQAKDMHGKGRCALQLNAGEQDEANGGVFGKVSMRAAALAQVFAVSITQRDEIAAPESNDAKGEREENERK